MNKKQQKKDDSQITLKDTLGDDLLKKLKEAKKEMEEKEMKRREEEEARKREERKKREKNKSFEELLNESNLDWKNFKQ